LLVAEQYLQAAYAGLQKSLQQEWQFLQRVMDSPGFEFKIMEQAMHREFLTALLGDELVADNLPRQLACLPVKKVGPAIPNPTTTAGSNWTGSMVMCGHLIVAIS
jgi:hypothetical protein